MGTSLFEEFDFNLEVFLICNWTRKPGQRNTLFRTDIDVGFLFGEIFSVNSIFCCAIDLISINNHFKHEFINFL